MREIHGFSSHRLNPRDTNPYTMNELQYLREMPVLSERFESSHRPVPRSVRNILHAAAFFDSNSTPVPTQYQLPPLDRLKDGETHQRNDSGYESAANTYMGNEDEDDGIDAWCDAVLAQTTLAEPNQHILRPDAAVFRPGIQIDSEIHSDASRKEIGGASSFRHQGAGHSGVRFTPDQDSENTLHLKDAHGQNRNGQFVVTECELEVLDYEGLHPRFRDGTTNAWSEGAESEDDEKIHDNHVEVGSRARWSF